MTIMAEEFGIDYRVHKINIGADDQFTAVNPNQKIPALVDSDGPGGEPYTVAQRRADRGDASARIPRRRR